jgi:hypothetical protein
MVEWLSEASRKIGPGSGVDDGSGLYSSYSGKRVVGGVEYSSQKFRLRKLE